MRSESQKFKASTCGVEMLAGGETLLPYLLGKPLPGRRHPVKAASRRSRAREQREPLLDGAALRSHDDKQVETHVAITAPARVSWRPPWTPHPYRMMHSTRPARRNTSNRDAYA
jgi:hypothetical protein